MSGNKVSDYEAAMPVYSAPRTPKGFQQIVDLSASVGLTVPPGAVMARVSPGTQAVRYRDDGTAPTATVGMPLAVGGILDYMGDLSAIRFIQQAASAVLNVSYYG